MDPTSFTADPGRLDTVVARKLGVPRADVQRAIAQGLVLVDGRRRQKSHRLAGGESVQALVPEPGELTPEPGPLSIPYQDDHLLVVSKPPRMATHPTVSRRAGTLVNRLLSLEIPLSRRGGGDRPGIVHRLDAGTSGLMVVAKDDATHAALAEMFRRHQVDRRYLALVRGRVEQERFLVDAALERRRARIRVGAATGKGAATEVEVCERLGERTLVEARPRTGRTHQIRVWPYPSISALLEDRLRSPGDRGEGRARGPAAGRPIRGAPSGQSLALTGAQSRPGANRVFQIEAVLGADLLPGRQQRVLDVRR